MVMQRPHRVLTPEEFRALPPPTEEELAERRAVVLRILAEVERDHQEFLARGGKEMSPEEWQEFWESLDDEDDERYDQD